MENFNTFIQRKTKNLAIKVVNGYTQINQKEHFSSAAVVLSKQFLRCGTSIGAMCSSEFRLQISDFRIY